MNPYWQLGGTVAAQLLIGAFVYGQLTQRVKDQGRSIGRHEEVLEDHGRLLANHERRISHIEGRKGFPLASD